MKKDSVYYSNNILHLIDKHHDPTFNLDILQSDVLMEPYFCPVVGEFDQDLKGQLCNYIHLENEDININYLTSLIGNIVLYQYPSRFSAKYNLRFVRILSIDTDAQTISLSTPSSETESFLEKINNLKRRSCAFRIWLPMKLYNMVPTVVAQRKTTTLPPIKLN